MRAYGTVLRVVELVVRTQHTHDSRTHKRHRQRERETHSGGLRRGKQGRRRVRVVWSCRPSCRLWGGRGAGVQSLLKKAFASSGISPRCLSGHLPSTILQRHNKGAVLRQAVSVLHERLPELKSGQVRAGLSRSRCVDQSKRWAGGAAETFQEILAEACHAHRMAEPAARCTKRGLAPGLSRLATEP